MQICKQLSNIRHLHVTLYHFLQKKSKFKQNPIAMFGLMESGGMEWSGI